MTRQVNLSGRPVVTATQHNEALGHLQNLVKQQAARIAELETICQNALAAYGVCIERIIALEEALDVPHYMNEHGQYVIDKDDWDFMQSELRGEGEDGTD